MEKRTREKIALVVFALLVVFAGVVLISYFATGRSWSMAASFVDDTIGSMDGYTVVVYAGTVEPEDLESRDGSSGKSAEGGLSGADSDEADGRDALSADRNADGDEGEADSADSAGADGRDALSADGGAGEGGVNPLVDAGTDAVADSLADVDADATSSGDTDVGADAVAHTDADADAASSDGEEAPAGDVEDTPADAAEEDASSAAREGLDALIAEARARGAVEESGDGGSLGLFSFLPSPFASVDEHVYVSDVRRTYERKNANVLTLDVATNRYVEPEILSVGGKRIGVYSTKAYVSRTRTNQVVSYFDENDVDVVLFITPMTSLLATYEGVDVVIVTTDREEGLSTRGDNVDDTFVVRAPEQGEVGVVLLTTNNVASAKVISSL